MTDDDRLNLEDLEAAERALIEARQALVRIEAGIGAPGDRQTFVFQTGFARGKLARVTERVYREAEA